MPDLLREYNYIFPNTFLEMKGIAGELGEMNIPLKKDVKLVKKSSYKLNPKYKEKSYCDTRKKK